MTASIVDTASTSTRVRTRRTRTDQKVASTSIRVSVPTRDKLARAAKEQGLSLSAYLDKLARKADKERIFAEFRASWAEALKDPEFVAEILEWDEMDDGIEFDDDTSEYDAMLEDNA